MKHQSTSKILGQLGGQTDTSIANLSDHDMQIPAPTLSKSIAHDLQPSSNPSEVLMKILGPSFSRKLTICD